MPHPARFPSSVWQGSARVPLLRLLFLLPATVLALSGLYLLLLYATAALPMHRLNEHLAADEARGEFTENHRLAFRDSVLDYYTECSMLGQAAMVKPTLQSIVEMRTCLTCPCLVQSLRTGLWTGGGYSRYWHGHLLLVKPLASLLRQDSMRLTVLVTSLGFLALFAYGAARTFTPLTAAILTGTLLLTSNFNFFVLSSHACSFWLALGAAITQLRSKQLSRAPWRYCVVGSLGAFFSLLQIDTLSLTLPLLCMMLQRLKEGDPPRAALLHGLWCCVGWGFGYGATWLVKWTLALAVAPDAPLMGDTVNAYWDPTLGSWLNAMGRLVLSLRLTLFAAALAWALFLRISSRRWDIRQGLACIALPAAIPLCWVFLLPGHTYLHHWFVNTILWPTLAAFMLLAFPPSHELDRPCSLVR